MRFTIYLSCAASALLLAACSNSPDFAEDRYSGLEDPSLYSDSANGSGAIPPGARARRAANPYPNSQGVSDEVRAAANRQQRAFISDPGPQDGYYASPRSRAQVQEEIDAEFQERTDAFGNITAGNPRPIDLGPGPGLTRISPDSRSNENPQPFRSSQQFESNLRVVEQPLNSRINAVPDDAPPLPSNARPGQCFVLVEHSPQYRNVTERVQTEAESTYWRSDCAPTNRVANSTGQTACLVREPARFETNTRRVEQSSGGYEWRQTPCETTRGNDHDQTVRNLQRALRREGYNPGPIDGIYGSKTRRAANAYQRDHGLPVDSQVNPSLLRDLGIATR